jgi:phasin
MPDVNPAPENVRVMLSEALGRVRTASQEYFGLLEKGLASSPPSLADHARQVCDFMRRNTTATFDLGDKLIRAKDMQDVANLQSEFFQSQMQAFTEQARSMGESAMKAATGVFAPKI